MDGVARHTREEWTADLPLGPGLRTLRVTLATGGTEATEPSLELALGFGGSGTGEPFTRPGWADRPLSLPARLLPALRRTLEAMEETLPEEAQNGPE